MVDIEASARKPGVTNDDMLHALRNHWRAFETDDPAVTMYIGPILDSRAARGRCGQRRGWFRSDPRDARTTQVPRGLVATMSTSRQKRVAALQAWAETVDPADLRTTDTESLRLIAELADRRDHLDAELAETVGAARAAHRSWSEIGAMLGVSKQAAQRKYGSTTPA